MDRSRDAFRASAALAVMAAAGLLSVALARHAWSTTASLVAAHRSPPGLTATDLADVVLLAVVAVGAVVAAWYALTAATVVVVALLPRTGSALERALRRYGAPVLRRTLLTTAVTGLGVAASLGPAFATTADQGTVPADLGWGAPLTPAEDGAPPRPADDGVPEGPDEGAPPATGGATPPPEQPPVAPPAPAPSPAPATPAPSPAPATPAPSPAPATPSAAASDAHVVTAGDTLWSITAGHLPDGATAADIAGAWPRWYEANRDVVGSDPDLIRPGQHLRAPLEENS
jgi:resuscitation-promoting factor RpfA